MSWLDVHQFFPNAQLRKRKHSRPEGNAPANFCFRTKDTNLDIPDRLPGVYLPEIERYHPGAIDSQKIPVDQAI